MREGWEYICFESCLNKIPKAKQVKTKEYNSGTKYPIISQEDKLISGYCDDESMLFHIDKPVIIFGDHTRVLKYIDFDFVVGADGVKIISPKENLNAKFLLYFLTWYNIPNLGYSRHYKLLKELDIPVPPLSTQLSIVSELDKINELIRLKKEQLKDYDNLAQSIFYEMFGDPVVNEKGWEVKKIGEVCLIERGGSPRPIKDYITEDEDGLNWIKIGDAQEGSIFINSTKEKIRKEGLKKTRMVHKGDFILSNSMSFGRPYIMGVDGCIHDGWLVLHDTNNTFNKLYLYYSLAHKSMYQQFKQMAVGGVVNNLNSEMVRRVLVLVPPLIVQQEFANRIELIEMQKKQIISTIQDLETLLASRMQYWFD